MDNQQLREAVQSEAEAILGYDGERDMTDEEFSRVVDAIMKDEGMVSAIRDERLAQQAEQENSCQATVDESDRCGNHRNEECNAAIMGYAWVVTRRSLKAFGF